LEDVLNAFDLRVHFEANKLGENTEVEYEVITNKKKLNCFFHPWYHREGKPGADWDYVGARPTNVYSRSLDDSLDTPVRQELIQLFIQSMGVFRTGKQPVPGQLTILCYYQGNDRRLVLDGNRRLAALARLATDFEWPFRLQVFTIVGPIDGSICPDLFHFQHGGVPEHLLKQGLI
jgi:hypothetical protein